AEKVLPRAYAPYSNYRVAAAISTEDGKIFTGVNVENASYGLTICAERAALFAAVSAGYRSFSHLVILSDGNGTVPYPCGACRQVLMEFSPDLGITVTRDKDRLIRISLRELLPYAFG
ncbi:MAG: cytidine deaminase, partial [Dethiobacteria bacterium]